MLIKDYPDDADVRTLVDAFEAGNYRAVRDGTGRIARDADKGEAVKAAARDLRSRTEPSRLQIGLLAITAVFVVVLSTYEIVAHNRNNAHPSPAARVTSEHVR